MSSRYLLLLAFALAHLKASGAPGGGTTVTFYSTATDDGFVLESTETSGVGGSFNASLTGTDGLKVGDDASDKQYKSIVSFDTSSLPDAAIVTTATLKLNGVTLLGMNPHRTHGSCYVDVKTGFFGAQALENSDFQAAATASQIATLSNLAINGNWSTGNLNAAGCAAINQTGYTQMRVYFSVDDNDDAGADYLGYYPGESATYPPTLEVTYILDTGTPTDPTMHPPRLANIEIIVSDSPGSIPPLELSELPGNRRVGVTAMWDDGMNSSGRTDLSHDLRMAQLMKSKGWKCTFAWPTVTWNMAKDDMAAIVATGAEIATHGLTHTDMTTLNQNVQFMEFAASKIFLSTWLDFPVTCWGDPYLKANAQTDANFYRADLLLARYGAVYNTPSIFNFTNRHAVSAIKVETGCTTVRTKLDNLIATGAAGDFVMMWGHVRDNDGWDAAKWTAYTQMLDDYGSRPDLWYATCGEVASYMFIDHATSLGSSLINGNTIVYPLSIAQLPRDVIAIPVGMRLAGSQSLLAKVTDVKVDGGSVPFSSAGGLLTFNVAPFAEDLHPRKITSDILHSGHANIASLAYLLSGEPTPDVAASWIVSPAASSFTAAVTLTNNNASALESFSFKVFAGTLWDISGEVAVPTTLAPGQTFQNTYTFALNGGGTPDGWTALFGRIDYVLNGTPGTHYLYSDAVWSAPSSPVAHFVGAPTSGPAPLTVSFTDTSANSPTSWAWDFTNDGTTDSTAQNPQYTYSSAGTYTVKLTVTNVQGYNSETKTNYLTATVPALLGSAVTVDWSSRHQTWEGFGASSMFYEDQLIGLPEPYRTEVFDLIFRDLGATILAIRPYHDFQPSEGASYNWNAMANQRTIVSAALSRGVINKIWARISSPPGWMKDNNNYMNGGHVLPQYYDEFAAYCRDYVLGMQNTYRIPIYGFSIFNEPGHSHPYETTQTTPEEFRDILKIVGADFDAHGLGAVKQFAPDSPMLQITDNYTGYNYLSTIASDPVALGYLDGISVHSYDDKAGNGTWPQASEAAAACGRPIWQTEVCHLSSAQHNIHGACRGSWWIHRAINLGNVTAWHWWQYYFPHEDTADQGLVDLVGRSGYTIYPRYYMFKQWARNVRPGAVRVNATSDNADLHVTAFKEGSTCYIVATSYRYNNPNTYVPATVDVTFNCPSITGAVGHIRTSSTENYATNSNLTPSNNSFTVSILGNTINTFIVTGPLPPELQIPSQTGSSIQEQGFRLRLTGTLNSFYVTEHSPDLAHWQPLSTNQFLGLPIELLDPGATNAPTRFYRARLVE